MNKLNLGRMARFVWRVEFIPYAVFTAIGVAVLAVTAGIGWQAVQHGSLIPPPSQPVRYDCSAPVGNFSLHYLHGTDRVQIRSAQGLLDGTVRNSRFDWQGFGKDRSLLGFAPPDEMVMEDGQTLRLSGVDLANVRCKRAPEPSPATTAPKTTQP